MELLITFTIFLWTPALLVIGHSLAWQIRFWQQHEFLWGRTYFHVWRENDLLHRRNYLQFLKFIAFLACASIAFSAQTIIPVIGILLAFTTWVGEMFLVFEKIVKGFHPWKRLGKRAEVIIGLGYALILISVVGLLITGYTLGIPSPIGQNIIAYLTQSPVWANIQLTYFYLLSFTLIGLTLDLGVPIWGIFLVLVTSPFHSLYNWWLLKLVREKIAANPQLLVIGIVGSYGKSTTKSILAHILQDQFFTTIDSSPTSSIRSIAHTVLHRLQPKSEVLLVEINLINMRNARRVLESLHPQLLIYTGIDRTYNDLHGGRAGIIDKLQKLLARLGNNTKLITNFDDPDAKSTTTTLPHTTLFYSAKPIARAQKVKHSLYPEIKHSKSGQDLYKLSKDVQTMDITLPHEALPTLHSTLAAAYAALEIGVAPKHIDHQLVSFDWDKILPFSVVAGDNNSTIWNVHGKLSLAKMKFINIALMNKQEKFTKRILCFGGINYLGEIKEQTHKDILDNLESSTNVVITHDRQINRYLRHNNVNHQVISVDTSGEMLYHIRLLQDPGVLIILAGDFDPLILSEISISI